MKKNQLNQLDHDMLQKIISTEEIMFSHTENKYLAIKVGGGIKIYTKNKAEKWSSKIIQYEGISLFDAINIYNSFP